MLCIIDNLSPNGSYASPHEDDMRVAMGFLWVLYDARDEYDAVQAPVNVNTYAQGFMENPS